MVEVNDSVLNQLDTLLGSRNNDLYGTKPEFNEEMFDRMFEFIVSLEPDQLSEEQATSVMDIIEDMELEYGNDIDEEDELDEVAPKRVRRNRTAARKRAKAYRRNRSQRKRAVKKYRKSARGRMMAKKSKRMAKRGKTATGKRRRTYR